MAPVNPGYSDKALGLRSYLVKQVMKQTLKPSQLSTVQIRLEDLWRALLHENFVFSFKNTLELSVYSSLEAKYVQWSWSFRSKMIEWEQVTRSEIRNSKPEQLNTLKQRLLEGLRVNVLNSHEKLKEDVQRYFEEHDQRDVLAQWQVETQNRLKRLVHELQNQAWDHCTAVMSGLKAREAIKNMNAKYQEQLTEKVKVLVSNLQKKAPLGGEDREVEERLETTFEEQWKGWILDCTRDAPVWQEIDIEAEVEESLTEFYKSEEDKIIKKLSSKRLREWGSHLQLIPQKKHVDLKGAQRSWISKTAHKFKDYVAPSSISEPGPVLSVPEYKECVEMNISDTFNQAKMYLRSRQTEDFNLSYTNELLGKVKDVIDSGDHPEFTYTKKYYIDMFLTVCGYAARQFERMRKAFLKENDPAEYLEREMKKPLFTLFKNQYLQIAGEKRAACTFCDLLAGSIRKEVHGSLGSTIFKDMRTLPHLANKAALKARILVDLGEDLQKTGDLSQYYQYLRNIEESIKAWLIRYTKEHCKAKGKDKRPKLALLASEKLNSLVRVTGEQVEDATKQITCENGIETSKWLEIVRSRLASKLRLEVFEGFKDLGDVKQLKDIRYFTEEVHKGLGALQTDLQDGFEHLTLDELTEKPYDLLFDELGGCIAQCPFCGEQCDCTNSKHGVKHSVKQHRPECLAKYRYMATQEMATEVCSHTVGSEKVFQNRDTNGGTFPYKRYRELYPKWSITADNSAKIALYWKWFVGNYSREIAEHFRAKDNHIPHGWKEYTWEQAKEEVKKLYGI